MSLCQGIFLNLQDTEYVSEKFEVLTVGNDDCVQMAKFIKCKSKDGTFENGRAFYEFTRDEEDLNSYKEVVVMVKEVSMARLFLLKISVARIDKYREH